MEVVDAALEQGPGQVLDALDLVIERFDPGPESLGEVEARIVGREVADVVVLPRTAIRNANQVLIVDEENRLLAIGEWVERGDAIMFCRRDAAAAEQDMHRMLDEISAALDGPPRGGIYYTCLARGPNLLGTDSEELKLIADRLGDFPLVGFFGNGEISHDRLYAYTGVLTLFV